MSVNQFLLIAATPTSPTDQCPSQKDTFHTAFKTHSHPQRRLQHSHSVSQESISNTQYQSDWKQLTNKPMEQLSYMEEDTDHAPRVSSLLSPTLLLDFNLLFWQKVKVGFASESLSVKASKDWLLYQLCEINWYKQVRLSWTFNLWVDLGPYRIPNKHARTHPYNVWAYIQCQFQLIMIETGICNSLFPSLSRSLSCSPRGANFLTKFWPSFCRDFPR